MARYKVQANQNIFDVAIHLYGSVEGLFDLLISNDWLSMDTQLKKGMELEYHEYFIVNESITASLEEEGLVPINGERNVYLKHPDEPLVMVVKTHEHYDVVGMMVAGEGTMRVDWGDNSSIQDIRLTSEIQTIEHYFDNEADARRLKLYGDFKLTYFDNSDLGGSMYLMRNVTVDEFVSRANGYSLDSLFLFDGTDKIALPACTVASLLPIGDMSLIELDLRSTRFTDLMAVDNYLKYVVDNYGQRRACTVYLDKMPGDEGVNAMKTILNEPEWNKANKWKFIINGEEFKA